MRARPSPCACFAIVGAGLRSKLTLTCPGANYTFGLRPLSRASRSFIGLISKAAPGRQRPKRSSSQQLRLWADSAPTVIALGRTGVRTRAGISLRARTASTTRACTTPSAPSAPAPPRFPASAQSPSSARARTARASTRLGVTSGREPGQTRGPCSRPCDSLTARGGQTGPKGAA